MEKYLKYGSMEQMVDHVIVVAQMKRARLIVIDRDTYYDWKNTNKLVRTLQPKTEI